MFSFILSLVFELEMAQFSLLILPHDHCLLTFLVKELKLSSHNFMTLFHLEDISLFHYFHFDIVDLLTVQVKNNN